MSTMEVQDRARRAHQVAKKFLVSNWAPFVRMAARSPKMPVHLTGSRPRTDGVSTWLRVPIELGDDTPHDKAVCGLRDELSIMRCPACKVLDRVTYTIFHEASHTVFGSFEKVSDYDLRQIIVEAIRLEADGKDDSSRAAKLKDRLEKNIHFVDSYIGAANFISPFLPMLLNAIEDTYVNAKMIAARPGIKQMVTASYNEIFENGSEGLDGVTRFWKDAVPDSQAIIGILCLSSGFDIDGWLDPKVVSDLDDPEIKSICDSVLDHGTAALRYKLAIRTLEALRRLGYCLSPDDPEDTPKGDPGPGEGEEPEGEDSSDDDGETGTGLGGEGAESDSEGEGAESTGAEAEPTSDDSEEGEGLGADDDTFGDEGGGGTGESSDSDDSDEEGFDGGDSGGDSSDGPDGGIPSGEPEPYYSDPAKVAEDFEKFSGHDHDEDEPTWEEEKEAEEIDRAIEQGDHFDGRSVLSGGLRIITSSEGEGAFTRGSGGYEVVGQSVLGPALGKARIAFTNNKRGKVQRNLESGQRLDGKHLATRFTMGDPRLFKARTRPGKRDYFVCIGIDVSGSTRRLGDDGMTRLVEIIKMAAGAQAELLSRLGIKFALYAHSGSHAEVIIHEVKGPDEPWGPQQKAALGRIGSLAANLDGHTMEFYRKVLDRRAETDRIILYYTDGSMPMENYTEELAVLQENIELCRRRGYTLLGVGVHTDSPTQHGLETVRLDGPQDVPAVVDALRKKL